MIRRTPFDATPILRLITGRRVAALRTQDAAAAQAALLRRLLRRASRTRFGAAHGFDGIRDVGEYQRRVPLRRYEAFWEEWWRPAYPDLRDVTWPGRVPYLALSSGTTSGRTKYVPVSREMVAANRAAALDVLAWHLAAHPRSRPFAGPSFMLGGSTDLEEVAPGIRQGDLSAVAAIEVPRFLRPWGWPPPRIALMADWDAKLAALAEETPAEAVRVLSGTPSWLIVLLERLAERRGMPPLPALELLIHGGVAWAPYRDRLRPYLPPGCATREVYAASEGFLALADRGDGEGMRLVADGGVFAEFVPLGELHAPAPTRHWAATLETDVDYAVVVTSCAGLWSYVLGDVVRFVTRDPPRMLVVGRTSYTLSTFGEHLDGEEIERAVLSALAAEGAGVAEYACGSVLEGTRGRHLYLVEPDRDLPPDAARRLAAAVDAALLAANDDYAAHRRGTQLDPPEVAIVPRGAFAAWMRAQGKMGGQHKVPRVIADPDRFAEASRALLAGSAGRAKGP